MITEFDSSPPSAIFQLSRGSLSHIQQYSSYIMVQKRLNHYQTWQGHPGSRTISRQKRETGLDKLKNPTDTAKCPVALRWRKAENPSVKGSRKETTVPLGEQPEPSDIIKMSGLTATKMAATNGTHCARKSQANLTKFQQERSTSTQNKPKIK